MSGWEREHLNFNDSLNQKYLIKWPINGKI